MEKDSIVKTIAWTFGGITVAIRPLISTTTTWESLNTPNFYFSILVGAVFGLKAYWSQSPLPSIDMLSKKKEEESK